MNVTAGTRLGPYEVVSRLGSGGMGEVWRAQDTRLDRSVAIKILPPEFARNAQLRLRFEREARTISQLNHPNICTLHDVGQENGVDYLVMELLDGETLADRIGKGPLPLEQLLRFGINIADALDKAHRSGVVHRDLKPGNVVLTKSGAKLLDFGLAKSAAAVSTQPEEGSRTEARGAATPLTQEGTILGTFQYMAPEQLEGAEADPRTDIFALGTLLYEMATGNRAFEGKTRTSLIAAIVDREPTPISKIRPLTPPAFEHVVTKCLEKDPEDRWQSAHDVAEQLRWISEAGSQAGLAAPLIARRKSRERIWWISALAASLIIAAVAVMRRPTATPMVLSLNAPLHAPFAEFGQAALSPDGNAVVFVGFSEKSGTSLWLRRIADREPKELPQTRGATHPFWSPDGQHIGFFAAGKLKRLPAGGGPGRDICDAPVPGGATWSSGGTIVVAREALGPLFRVDANGGTPVQLTRLAGHDEAHRWPAFLPDGEHFIFLADAARTEHHIIRVGSLRDGSTKDLTQGVTNATYAEPGYLLYVRGGSLLAQRFDTKRLALSGEPQVIADQVAENAMFHHHEFAAANGRLIYRSMSTDSQLAWIDRSGKVQQTIGEPRRIDSVAVSPDQQRIAFAQLDADGRGEDIWLFDGRRRITTRLTLDPASDLEPVWSPDGSRVAFRSMRTGLGDLYVTEAANPANVQQLMTAPGGVQPTSWSRDGEFILLEYDKNTDIDIWLYSTRTGKGTPYLATPFAEGGAVFSPDRASVAYASEESGRAEIYIERFPSHAGRRQVSTDGGSSPAWRADGRELFYVMPGGQLMSVDVTNDASTPAPLFRLPGVSYWPAPDGQRFMVDRPVDEARDLPLTFVSNWTALLKQ